MELEEFSWLDLPTDVVKLILLKLRFEDGAKLACVCRMLRDIIKTSPPIYPVGKSTLLIHVKSRGEVRGEKGAIFHYYSPLFEKAFQLEYPVDLRGFEIIGAKDGILLIYNRDGEWMKMVDPLLGQTINIPRTRRSISFNGTAIGVRDKSYVIFLIDTSDEDQVTVHLYRKGGWVLNTVYDNDNEPFYLTSNPVYFDGRFYCLDSKSGSLGVFDIQKRNWDVYSVEFMNIDDDDHVRCRYYLVDWIDTVMAVRVKNNGSEVHLFVLDRKKMAWKETDDLCGRSLFLGSTLSAMSLPTAKKLQNRVFLPHTHQDEPKPVVVAEAYFCSPDRFYFRPKSSSTSSWEENHAATTICCCNNSGEVSQHLGSTQNQEYCTIWYQPYRVK